MLRKRGIQSITPDREVGGVPDDPAFPQEDCLRRFMAHTEFFGGQIGNRPVFHNQDSAGMHPSGVF